MNAPANKPSPPWIAKFRYAFRGLRIGVAGQSSFVAHLPIALAVVAGAAWLDVRPAEWCVLLLCIMVVFSAELFNSALEHLAKAVSRDRREELRDALDTAAAAVLVAAMGSVVVGAIIFAPRLLPLLP